MTVRHFTQVGQKCNTKITLALNFENVQTKLNKYKNIKMVLYFTH